MKIFINDKQVTVFHGAKVIDVIRAYYLQEGKKMPSTLPIITDGYGNTVAEDGQLSQGNHLYIKTKNNRTMKSFFAKLKVLVGLTVFGVSLMVGMMGCGTSRKVAELPQARTVEILAVNDMHAAIDNFPRLAFMVDSLRAIYPHLLLVSGGDNQTGNPANDQYPQKGMPMIELMNAVNFDLSAVGNHEFDSRLSGFEHITHKAEFDFLSANIEQPKGSDFRVKPYEIVETPNGLKIAFVSFLNINPNGIPDTHPDNVKGFVFNNPYEKAQEYLFLKDSANLFVMLNHMGFEEDVTLANQMPAESVHLIIGGHSHTKIDTDQIHNGIMITQAERKLKYATLIKLTVAPDGEVEREMELLTVGKKGSSRADIQKMVDAYNNNPALTETIAVAEDDFSTFAEIGYMMMDALRKGAEADIALINPGGVRISELSKGPVRTRDVYEMDPFGNEIVQYNLSGHELHNLFLAAYTLDEDRPIFPSGMTTRYLLDTDGSLKDVELFTTDGEPFDMDKMYTVVMNDYDGLDLQIRPQRPGSRTLSTHC